MKMMLLSDELWRELGGECKCVLGETAGTPKETIIIKETFIIII